MSTDTAELFTSGEGPAGTSASRLFAAGAHARQAAHLASYGAMPVSQRGVTLRSELQAAGLTGRGGAAFDVARKFAALDPNRKPGHRTGRQGRPVLIANGAEGEPLSFKDAALLHHAPHLVIDGLLAAARELHAGNVYIYTGADQLDTVAQALAERADAADIILVESPDTFLAGQGSAVVNFLESGKALPTDRSVRLAEKGFKGRPTLVNNVETWAHIALVARYGAGWYRQIGTPSDPGTRLVSLTGDVPDERVLEVPGGAPLATVLGSAGVALDGVSAVLVGGYHGRWVQPAGMLLGYVDPRGSAAPTARPGAGVVHVLGRGGCGLAVTAQIATYLAEQSARQCGPCVFGLPALADTMNRLAAGTGGSGLVRDVQRLGTMVAGRGACHHPDGTVQLINSALDTFAEDVRWHLAGQCAATGGAL